MDRDLTAADTAKTAAALRSQLNQMAAASQVLERNTTDEKGRSYLAVINQSICRMLRIVGRMELSHRLADEKVQLNPRHIDLALRLEYLSNRLSGVLADIGVTFTLNAPGYLPVCADGELLQQMLLELISNMALAAAHITLTVTQKDSAVHFTLSDNGPGEAKDRPALPSVLEEDEEKASLELARSIAALHGGTVVVSTDADLALSMAVSIPLEKAPANLLESPRTPWYSGGFDSVLVAMSGLLPARSFLPENLG